MAFAYGTATANGLDSTFQQAQTQLQQAFQQSYGLNQLNADWGGQLSNYNFNTGTYVWAHDPKQWQQQIEEQAKALKAQYIERIQQEKQPVDMRKAKYVVVIAGQLSSFYETEDEAYRAANQLAGGKTEVDAYVFKAVKLVRPKPKEVESVDL